MGINETWLKVLQNVHNRASSFRQDFLIKTVVDFQGVIMEKIQYVK